MANIFQKKAFYIVATVIFYLATAILYLLFAPIYVPHSYFFCSVVLFPLGLVGATMPFSWFEYLSRLSLALRIKNADDVEVHVWRYHLTRIVSFLLFLASFAFLLTGINS